MNKNTFQKTVHTKGAALLLFVVLFLATSLSLVLSIGRGVYDDVAMYKVLESGKESFYGAESGVEDAILRHKEGDDYSDTENFTFKNVAVSITRTIITDYYQIIAEGNQRGAVRKSYVELVVGDGATFSFGLQSGNGGITMSNNSKVRGNVFSNGTVVGQGSATVYGDIITTEATGLVDSIHATGSVYAHTIDNSTIDMDAHYFDPSTITATIVAGTQYPGSADQAAVSMPIPDSLIDEWKTTIETTGTIIASTSPQCSSGTYTIDTTTTIGNVKIECNVDMKKQGASTVITITGPIWVEGNLSFSQGPSIVASSSLRSRSVQLIADDESDRLTSSKITVNQSTVFSSGSAASYVLLLSNNNSAETGGTEKAVNLAQSVNGKVLVYAGHGLVDMGNSISLKEVTAYQISISNGTEIIYESGLANLLFTAGPGGGFTISSWKEVI
jgi:hypothetical protein